MTGCSPEQPPATSTQLASELIGALPRELSWLLIAAGIGGVLLPGPVGTPFLLLGGAMFCPRLFMRLESGFQRVFPRTHHWGARQIRRYLADMERRYP